MTPYVIPHLSHLVSSQYGKDFSPSAQELHNHSRLGKVLFSKEHFPQFKCLQYEPKRSQCAPQGGTDDAVFCSWGENKSFTASSVLLLKIFLLFIEVILDDIGKAVACRLYGVQQQESCEYPHYFVQLELDQLLPAPQPIADDIASENSVVESFVKSTFSVFGCFCVFFSVVFAFGMRPPGVCLFINDFCRTILMT